MFNIFGAGKPHSGGVSSKRFQIPNRFEYHLHFALRLMACEHNGDFLRIEAKNGTVKLYINGIQDCKSLAKAYTPGLYQLFYQHPTYSNGSVQLTFREPDCYIFNCSKEGIDYDLREHAPNASISSWTEAPGSKNIGIRFAPFLSSDEIDRWNAVEALYKQYFF